MSTLTCGCGSFSSGWNTYTYAGVMQIANEDEGRSVVVSKAIDDFYTGLYDTFVGIYSWKDAAFLLVTFGAGKIAGRFAKFGLDFARKYNLDKEIVRFFSSVFAAFSTFTIVGNSSQIVNGNQQDEEDNTLSSAISETIKYFVDIDNWFLSTIAEKLIDEVIEKVAK